VPWRLQVTRPVLVAGRGLALIGRARVLRGWYLRSACFGGCLRACDQPGPALLQQPGQEHIIVITCDRPFQRSSYTTLIYPPYLSLPLSLHLHPLLHHHQPLSFSIVNNRQSSFILYPSAFIHCHSLDTLALVGHHEDYLCARSRRAGRRCYRQGPQAQAGQGASL
jgi:hypothetical protein